MWAGAGLANVSYVARAIRKDWPTALIYINEAQDVVSAGPRRNSDRTRKGLITPRLNLHICPYPQLMCNFNRLGEKVFADGACVPPEVDWIGFDIYRWVACDSPSAGCLHCGWILLPRIAFTLKLSFLHRLHPVACCPKL